MVFLDSPVCTVLVTITAVDFLGGVVPAGTGDVKKLFGK
jgi:hypothetical protein